MPSPDNTIESILNHLYGPGKASQAHERITALIDRYKQPKSAPGERFSQSDVVLITYGDTLLNSGEPPLQALHQFAAKYLNEIFSAIHFLPFFPFSSDDGFSVTDFMQINPELGTWEDVAVFRDDFDLMFDYVLNHVSAKSQWFARFLEEVPGFEQLAIEVEPDADLTMVTRPRALPLLTPFKKTSGRQVHVWTTFSADQVDLNYQSVEVLGNMVEVLLAYVARGARLIRMDAIAYLWKEIGTPCIHLQQTHDVLRLFRLILDRIDPGVIIITETNVPHAENISYFGNGRDEAQMVYNFSLAPLLLHALATGDASDLIDWAGGLYTPSDETTFFNFTASHDGIGVRPLEGILPADAIQSLADLSVANGGQVSCKQNSDGSQSPYELNVTYLDALDGDPKKFLASQAIQLALPGVPAVYIHSLLGSRNWHEGVAQTGRARTINRAQLSLGSLLDELEDPDSYRAGIFHPYCRMLKIRRAQPAFHPNAGFELLEFDRRVFGIARYGGNQRISALTNISPQTVRYTLEAARGLERVRDLISGRYFDPGQLTLYPYQYLWLEG